MTRPPAKPAPRARARSAKSAPRKFCAYFGVPPEKVVDVQALAGDSTDNVPGARGIGLKTAAQLINEYGDLDTLLARANEIKQPKRRETLTDPESVALIHVSKQLVSLVRDVPLEVPLDDLRLNMPDGKTLVAFFKAMEFTTITKRAAEAYAIDASAIEPDPAFAGRAGWRGRDGAVLGETLDNAEPSIRRRQARIPARPSATPATASRRKSPVIATGPGQLAEARAAEARAQTFDTKSYETISSFEQLDRIHRRRVRGGRDRDRHGNIFAAAHAGRARRHLSLRHAGARLLHSAAPQKRRRAAISSAATIFCPANCRKRRCSRG